MTRILMGVIGKPHGVRGLVRVQSYTADPSSLTAYGPLQDEAGRLWRLRWRGDGVVEIRDQTGRIVDSRTEAEKLINMRLFAERGQLPSMENGDEFYHADLIGMRAVGLDGALLGAVTQVHDYGAGVSLEVTRPIMPALLVPFTRVCVPDVDVGAGTLVVVPPNDNFGTPDA